jgi:hypothetical protein
VTAKLATARATLRWAATAAVDRALRGRDERNFDRGMLAGLETAENAVGLGSDRRACCDLIGIAREGYLQEMASR